MRLTPMPFPHSTEPVGGLIRRAQYLFDFAAGLLVTGVGFWAGRLTSRPLQQRPGVPAVRRLIPATRR